MIESMARQFNAKYKLKELQKPKLPTDQEATTCHTLILAGLMNLNEAFDVNNMVDIAEAFSALLYVTTVQAEALGYPVDALVREAHSAAMEDRETDVLPVILEKLNEH